MTVFCLPPAGRTGRSLSQIDLALGVPLLPSMLPAPLPEMTPPPAGSQVFRRSSPATYGDSNSDRTPSFESYLSRRSFERQVGHADEDHLARSSAEGESVGVGGHAAAASVAHPRQRVGQETFSSGRGQRTPVNTGQQESSAAGPSSSGSTAGQGQREGRAQADTIAPGEPYGRGGKVLASSQAASETASTSKISGRLGLFVGEPLQALGGLQRPPGSDQLSQVQNEPGSTPRSITPLSTAVEPLEVVGQRPIGGTGLDPVPAATSNTAGEQVVGVRQLGLTETSDSKTLESNLPKVERPNQASPHPGDVSREGLSGAISSELLSETLQTGHGAPVGQKPSVKPVAVSETPAPAGQVVFRQPSETPTSAGQEVRRQPSETPTSAGQKVPRQPSEAPTSAGQEVFRQPSDRVLEEPSPALGAAGARFSEKLISENTEHAVLQSRTRPEPARESGESSARDQQPQLSDREAGSPAFPEVGSNSAVVTRAIPEVSPLTGLPPNDAASFRAAFGVALPLTPEPVPTPRKSNAQASEQQEVRRLGPPSTNTRQANLPRLPHSAAELSIESQPDGSSRDRLAGHSLKLEAPGESSKPPSGHPLPRDGKGARELAPVELSLADRETSGGRPESGSRRGTSSGTAMSNTPAGENVAELSALSKSTRSGDRTPLPVVKGAAPTARSEVAAISHTPAEPKAAFVLPRQSSAQNVDAGSPQAEAYQEASGGASRVRSVERLVDMAALYRKIDSHQMNLLLSDDRIGRISVRLVERGGVIDTLVRTDSTRASHLFTEGLPSLLESLAQRGLQASHSGAGHFFGSWEDAQSRQGGRYRPPRHPQRQSRRGGSEGGRVFRLEFE